MDIIRRNEDFVLMDGSLQLTYGAGSSAAEGSGQSSATGMPLPPLPSTVDTISISWHASEEVREILIWGVTVWVCNSPLMTSSYQHKDENM